jgi:hypothetical protein
MARMVRDANLETRTARARLKVSGKPYYRAIDPGLHLGYRKGRAGGKWVIRSYIGDGAYQVETIATADDSADPDGIAVLDFRQAQALVRQKHLQQVRTAQGLSPMDGVYTVKGCINDYLAFLEQNRKSAKDARWRAEALILPTLGELACADLSATQLRGWLDGLAKAPPRLRSPKDAAPRHRDVDQKDAEKKRKRRATANRTLTILKAALNRAWREGKIGSDDAWRRVEPYPEADAPRVRYLTIDECQRLIQAAMANSVTWSKQRC